MQDPDSWFWWNGTFLLQFHPFLALGGGSVFGLFDVESDLLCGAGPGFLFRLFG
jgi:hypothetical protein